MHKRLYDNSYYDQEQEEARDAISSATPPYADYLKGSGDKMYDPEFLAAAQDLFSGKRAGHAFTYVMTGKGMDLWEQFTRAASVPPKKKSEPYYYPFEEEAQLIETHPEWFKMMAGLSVGEGSVVVELGTGSDYSAERKTLPFLDAVNAQVYVGVDKSMDSAAGVITEIRKARPHIASFIRITDFNREDMRVEWHEMDVFKNRDLIEERYRPAVQPLPEVEPRRRILAQFGTTLGNIEGFIDDDPPLDKVVSYLRNYRRNMRKGDILFIGLDQNQDPESLNACYASPLIAEFSMEMLGRMQRELPHSISFNPNNFEYVRMWNRRNGLYYHGFNTLQDTAFKLGDLEITSKKNSKSSYVNAWKFRQNFMEQAFWLSDLKIKGRLDGPKDRIHIHALEAV